LTVIEDIWSSITVNEGSVQHLDFLTPDEKDVFKTAFELDQRWIVELAGDRTPFVCQSQSINVFLPADVHKRDLHQIHFLAWKKGLKSLYYCRSKSIQRAETAQTAQMAQDGASQANGIPHLGKINGADHAPGEEPIDYDECLACQ
jgi:ribonucleoside-diphosphate reductase alpha chain